MLYYLFQYINQYFDFPGLGLFNFLTFRAACAIILSLIISLIIGRRLINVLQVLQIGETVRDLGLEGQTKKAGTPTMGGLIILASIVIPCLLFARLQNTYIIILLVTTVWLGFIGFLDDYIKVFKKDKEGLAGKFKILGQVLLGIFVGLMLYFSPNSIIRIKATPDELLKYKVKQEIYIEKPNGSVQKHYDVNAPLTTIPFLKNNEFNYTFFIQFLGENAHKYTWIIYVLMVIFIITAVSNAANLTDGIDGLATGVSAVIGAALGLFAWVSGNTIFSDYLHIMYIPNLGELLIFAGCFVGSCLGFFWYNAYPARVFMGDTGSLALGGIIAVFALCIRKELLIPVLCGIFLVENLSVMLQVAYFKYTKRKFGEGRRIFLMSPLHHHFQKKGIHENKITIRFIIVGIMLAIVSIITLKLR